MTDIELQEENSLAGCLSRDEFLTTMRRRIIDGHDGWMVPDEQKTHFLTLHDNGYVPILSASWDDFLYKSMPHYWLRMGIIGHNTRAVVTFLCDHRKIPGLQSTFPDLFVIVGTEAKETSTMIPVTSSVMIGGTEPIVSEIPFNVKDDGFVSPEVASDLIYSDMPPNVVADLKARYGEVTIVDPIWNRDMLAGDGILTRLTGHVMEGRGVR